MFETTETTALTTAPKRGLLRRLGRFVLSCVHWAVFLAAILAIAGVIGLIMAPRVLGWQGIVVLSGSMEPALPTGGIAFVQPMNADKIAVGDMLTHRTVKGPLITHRVIEVIPTSAGPSFMTKGDANEVADIDPVPASQVLGKVRFQVPYLGYLVNRLQHRQDFYILIGIPASLLVLNELWNIATDVRKSRHKRDEARETAS